MPAQSRNSLLRKQGILRQYVIPSLVLIGILLIWDFTIDRITERPLIGWGLAVGVAHSTATGTSGNLIDNLYAYVPSSLSFGEDAVVMHLNLGVLQDRHAQRTRGTWGLATEVKLFGHTQLIAETFGERGERPFGHAGLRIWLVPDHLQIDTTVGLRFSGDAQAERWISIGLRWISVPFLP